MSGPLLRALAAGVLSGLMIAAPTYLGLIALPLFMFASVPTFAVGLSQGGASMLYALAAAAATAATGNLEVMLRYIVFFAAPQAWLIRQALLSRNTAAGVEWYPPGRLLAWLIGMAVFFVVTAMLLAAGAEGGLVGSLESYFEQALSAMAGLEVVPLAEDDIGHMAPALALIAPAAMASGWILLMVGNGTLAQVLVARGGRNLRPSTPFTELELPPGLVYALGVALVLSLVPGTLGFLGKTLIAVITTGYFILGLALIHALTRGIAARRAVLIVTYSLIVILRWLAVAVVVLGLAEQVFGLRKRFFGTKKGQEEE